MKSDVIVIGVGGMGASCAYHLVKRGLTVIGLEQFQAAHDRGSSHGETRMIRKAYFEHPDYVPLLKRAYELWADLSRESGRDLYHETGIFYSLKPDSEIARGIQMSAKKYNIPLESLPNGELGRFAKYFSILPGNQNFFEPESGYLEVENCTLAHIHQARQLGAQLQFGETVEDINFSTNSVEVRTNKNKYSVAKIIFTAGAWTTGLLRDLNLPLKVRRKILCWYKTSAAASESLGMPCYFFEDDSLRTFYGFPDVTGGTNGGELKCAEHSGGDNVLSPAAIRREVGVGETQLVDQFAKTYLAPAIISGGDSLSPVRTSVCMYTMTPDEHFILDRHPKHANAYFACGFSGHGYKFASVIGESIADFCEGKSRNPVEFLGLKRFL